MHHPLRMTVSRGVLALLVLLASCGGRAAAKTAATSSPDPSATDAAPRQSIRVERPSGTPLGNVTPPADPAYLLLSLGRCGELLRRTGTWRDQRVNEDAFFLYRAAAETCLGRWDDARRDYERLLALDPKFSGGCDSTNCERCMREVQTWLAAVLASRQRLANRDVEFVNGTGRSPCPLGSATTKPGGAGQSGTRSTSTSTSQP